MLKSVYICSHNHQQKPIPKTMKSPIDINSIVFNNAANAVFVQYNYLTENGWGHEISHLIPEELLLYYITENELNEDIKTDGSVVSVEPIECLKNNTYQIVKQYLAIHAHTTAKASEYELLVDYASHKLRVEFDKTTIGQETLITTAKDMGLPQSFIDELIKDASV